MSRVQKIGKKYEFSEHSLGKNDLTERTDGCVDGRIAQSEDIIALANDLSSDGLARMIIKDLIQLCDDDKQIILSLVHRLKK